MAAAAPAAAPDPALSRALSEGPPPSETNPLRSARFFAFMSSVTLRSPAVIASP